MILTDKDLQLLNSMPSSSEPDSSGSQGDLKIGMNHPLFQSFILHLSFSYFHLMIHSLTLSIFFFAGIHKLRFVIMISWSVEFLVEFMPEEEMIKKLSDSLRYVL